MSDIFPELTEFLRHTHRHHSGTDNDSQRLLPTITTSALLMRQHKIKPVERATKTLSPANSAPMQLLRQKRMAPRDSGASKRLSTKGSNKDRKLLDQILEGEGLEEQIEMIRQQELRFV